MEDGIFLTFKNQVVLKKIEEIIKKQKINL